MCEGVWACGVRVFACVHVCALVSIRTCITYITLYKNLITILFYLHMTLNNYNDAVKCVRLTASDNLHSLKVNNFLSILTSL